MSGEELQKPRDFEGFSVQKDLPTGDFRERPYPNNLRMIVVTCPECHNANREARRACRTCEGEGGVTKFVTQEELDEAMGANCQVWAEVDFGRGPVVVRCTQTDEHEEHACVVIMNEEPEEPDPSNN